MQGISGNFHPFYTINFRGGRKSGGARAPAAPSSSAPMLIFNCNLLEFVQLKKFFGAILHRN